jgi:hypothetical protein
MTALLLVCGLTFAEGSVLGAAVAREQWILLSMPYTDSSEKVVQEDFPGSPAPEGGPIQLLELFSYLVNYTVLPR